MDRETSEDCRCGVGASEEQSLACLKHEVQVIEKVSNDGRSRMSWIYRSQ